MGVDSEFCERRFAEGQNPYDLGSILDNFAVGKEHEILLRE